MKKSLPTIIALLVIACSVIGLYFLDKNSSIEVPVINELNSNETVKPPQVVQLKTEIITEGLNKPWEIAFLPSGDFLINERGGSMTRFDASGQQQAEISGLPDIYAQGEGGLLGLAVDPEFNSNNYVYACYDTREDIRLSRWQLADDELSDQTDIVTGMPVNTTTFPGRHSGCRMNFDEKNHLWIGTGDVAQSSNPQDPQSLGGKVLRVDRDGSPVKGNQGGEFDPRIFSYGHRNVQGIALTENGVYPGYSIEHGPSEDDEINALVTGNFGWDPGDDYDESVPMTDIDTFPEAVDAVWSSGSPTLAPSGASMVYGEQWGDYDGDLFVAMQKSMHLRHFKVNDDGSLGEETKLFENEFGRLRTVRQGPDSALYILTDNGADQDKIIKVTPTD